MSKAHLLDAVYVTVFVILGSANLVMLPLGSAYAATLAIDGAPALVRDDRGVSQEIFRNNPPVGPGSAWIPVQTDQVNFLGRGFKRISNGQSIFQYEYAQYFDLFCTCNVGNFGPRGEVIIYESPALTDKPMLTPSEVSQYQAQNMAVSLLGGLAQAAIGITALLFLAPTGGASAAAAIALIAAGTVVPVVTIAISYSNPQQAAQIDQAVGSFNCTLAPVDITGASAIGCAVGIHNVAVNKILNDPPDSNYQIAVIVPQSPPSDFNLAGLEPVKPLLDQLIDHLNTATDYANAALASMEKAAGAQSAGDEAYVVLHSGEYNRFAALSDQAFLLAADAADALSAAFAGSPIDIPIDYAVLNETYNSSTLIEDFVATNGRTAFTDALVVAHDNLDWMLIQSLLPKLVRPSDVFAELALVIRGTSSTDYSQILPVGAPVLVCDTDSDADVDRNDVRAITAARNQPASGADDPRDANGDGVINILDARQCTKQCTRPSCAI